MKILDFLPWCLYNWGSPKVIHEGVFLRENPQKGPMVTEDFKNLK
jgi:hypothetical protein